MVALALVLVILALGSASWLGRTADSRDQEYGFVPLHGQSTPEDNMSSGVRLRG